MLIRLNRVHADVEGCFETSKLQPREARARTPAFRAKKQSSRCADTARLIGSVLPVTRAVRQFPQETRDRSGCARTIEFGDTRNDRKLVFCAPRQIPNRLYFRSARFPIMANKFHVAYDSCCIDRIVTYYIMMWYSPGAFDFSRVFKFNFKKEKTDNTQTGPYKYV